MTRSIHRLLGRVVEAQEIGRRAQGLTETLKLSTKDNADLKKSYIQFLQDGNVLRPVGDVSLRPALQPFAYRIESSMHGPIYVKFAPKTDELLLFKNSVMEKILQEIDKFWGLKENFNHLGFLHNRGILVEGPPGCQPARSKVLMADGEWRNVEDVKVGDKVVSPQHDGSVIMANVTETVVYPQQPTYTLRTKLGSYRCAWNHIVPMIAQLKQWIPGTGIRNKTTGKQDQHEYRRFFGLHECQAHEYVSRGSGFKQKAKLFTTPPIEFPAQDLVVHPYVIGAILGDGCVTQRPGSFCNASIDIFSRMIECGAVFGQISWSASRNVYSSSFLRLFWDQMLIKAAKDVLGHDAYTKFIPEQYKRSSISQRLELLAGLFDTDGNEAHGSGGSYGTCSKRLVGDIRDVIFSVGGTARITEADKTCQTGASCHAYIVNYSFGEHVPSVVLPHKQPTTRDFQWKNHRNRHFTATQSTVEDVYGFVLDSPSEWYVTDNWIVTHNTGKSCLFQQVSEMMINRDDIVFFATDVSALREGLKNYREVEPDRKLVVIFEDIDEVVGYSERGLLQLLDGDAQIQNVLYLACMAPEHRILTKDLRWVPAGDIRQGDELWTLDEHNPHHEKGGGRRYQTGTVTSSISARKNCVRVHFRSGLSLTCTADHPWLACEGNIYGRGHRPYRWVLAKDLCSGPLAGGKHNCVKPFDVWNTETTYDAGWLSGMFDGEGCVGVSGGSQAGGHHGLKPYKAAVSQAIGPTFDRLKVVTRQFTNDFTVREIDSQQVGVNGDPYKVKGIIEINGGPTGSALLLGKIRPQRLLSKFDISGVRVHGNFEEVVEVEPIGMAEIQSIETDTHTYFCEGFAMHNSTNYLDRIPARLRRPGRFDKVIHLGPPQLEGRIAYLEHKLKGLEKPEMIRWIAEQTQGFSFGHMRELTIGAYAMKEPLKEVITRLRTSAIDESTRPQPAIKRLLLS